MLPVAAPLTSIPPVVQPQLESIRRDNARFEVIPEPTGTGAGSRPRPEADDYDRNRTGLESRDAISRTDGQRLDGATAAGSQTGRPDATGRVDPDGRNNSNANPQQSSQQGSEQNPRDRQQQQQAQAQIAELKSRDREVRAHEAAHAAVGGQYAGAPVLQYQKGPDGRRYAVAGEVSIDTSTVPDNPQATIRKLETVRAAALAPADPSPQDRQVAARASILIADARRQLALQMREDATRTDANKGTDRSDASDKTGSSKLASDSASEAVFGSDTDLQSAPASKLTVFSDAPLRSPCPMCSKPHLSPLTSTASLPSNFSLTDRLRTLGVTDFSSRDFRASA